MDELLHHCLRELSFDGDLGCNITRLRDFILGSYSNLELPVGQNTDDAFCAFVWSLIVQHPTVQVGLKPPNVTSEIWIAPQTSTKRKVKTSGEESTNVSPPKLIPATNAKSRPLADLVQEYGDNLRIAIEPEAIYATITGTHIRSSKVSPMVYTALQIITRGRDNGVSVVELGQKTKYDQKTCFYLVKQLTELDLVAKVRRGGVGTHFCIYKYFFERNLSWKAIREEEIGAEEGQRTKDLGEELEESPAHLGFSPIDARHLSSLPLIRARVVKLLQAAKNQIHPSNNMLMTIGFANPTKTDRRFFQSRIRELIQQGIVEKVVVPSRKRKSGSAYVKCLRLVTGDKHHMDGESVSSPEPEDDKDEVGQEGIKVNITVHRQVIDLLEDAGTDGMTLQDLSMTLGDFDKRTLELILTRAERYPPPSHLKDLGVVSLMETSGRERRHRYFTSHAYKGLLSKEKFEAPDVLSDIDFAHTGEFSLLEEASFYAEKPMLQNYQDGYQDKMNVSKPRKRPLKNPILPDGRVKLGRPRKKLTEQTVRSEGKTTAPGASITPVMIDLSPAKKRRIEPTPDEVPQSPPKRGRQKANRMSSENINKSKKRTRSGETTGNRAEPKRIKVLGSSSVDQGPSGEGRPDGRSEWIGSEKLPQHDKDTEASFEMRGVISIASKYNVEDQELAVAPRSTLSGRFNYDTTSNAEMLHRSVSVPIDPGLLVDQALVKGTVTSVRGKVNVSHLRRENEIYRIVSEQGGIVNIQSREFYAAHKTLIEALAKAGEATSAPIGTTLDKRTLGTTLDGLERRGRVKQVRSSIVSPTGVSRPVCIVYLPEVPQERLNNFLADLSHAQLPSLPCDSYVKIDEQVEFGVHVPSTPRTVLPLQLLQMEQPGGDRKERWSRNTARARQLFSYDDETIRSVLLTERTTLSQSYGWIVGKVARARHLHLFTLSAFEAQEGTGGIICREHKIIDLSYYCREIPLELYCSLISVLQHDENLKQFLGTTDGRQMHVQNLSAHFHSFLQIGRSRARSRFLEIFEVLWFLNLVLPVRLSKSESSSTCCSHTGNDQIFELVDFTSSSINAIGTHSYWKFESQAPIPLPESSASLQKHVHVATEAESRDYWNMLQEFFTNPDSPPDYIGNGAGNSESRISLIRSLRRASSWTSEYVFTWHQTQYMKQFIDYHTARTPLQEENEMRRASNVNRIAWVISAPEEAVRSFFSAHHRKAAMGLERSERKIKQRSSDRKARATAEVKASLAKKVAQAQQQREQGWEDLVSRLHPAPIPATAVVRLKRIRTRFMQAASTQDQDKWESELKTALHEADLITRKIWRTSEASIAQLPLPAESRVPLNGEKSIEVLIAEQGPALSIPTIDMGKNRGGNEGDKTKTRQRRPRFLWNHDYDELARDAAAIIKARCRGLSRLDWGAFEQVFPAVPRNTVRQRLAHIRESPSDEAYLNRLEEQWYALWLEHKGTSVLPDEDPSSPTNFDLARHVEFLRAHIDKNALRVGFAQPHEKSSSVIPFSVDVLLAEYTLGESTPSVPLFDFMWNTAVEEGREKRLMHQSFTMHPEEVALNLTTSSDPVNIAEAALKMALGTPHERYEAGRASNLMRSAGESAIECAKKNLLDRGVLSKLVRDPQKQKPGRQLKISEANQNAVGGPISRDTFQDAASLEGLTRQEHDWREWPLLATDGDAAALAQAVSENKVKFKVDTSQVQAARVRLDWNSKKADDDQIETAILVKFDTSGDYEPLSPAGSAEVSNEALSSHPSTACCKNQVVNGLVDCEVCLENEWSSVYSSLDEEEKGVTQRILDVVREAGAKGISKSRLRDLFHLTDHQLFTIVQRLIDATISILFWAGYDAIVLVHSIYLSKWTVVVSEDPLTRLHPRRWYDIEGYRIPAYWEAALRCVMGLVIFRPGITQHEMRWRLRAVYDRQELNDILEYLGDEGFLHMRQKEGSRFTVLPIDDPDEREVFWFTGCRAWYRV